MHQARGLVFLQLLTYQSGQIDISGISLFLTLLDVELNFKYFKTLSLVYMSFAIRWQSLKGGLEMKRIYKVLVLCTLIVFSSVLLFGCVEYIPVTVRGGGWVPVMNEESKATFGFTICCENIVYEDETPIDWEAEGNFVYIDKLNSIRIKGDIDGALMDGEYAYFGGMYYVGDESGEFFVMVQDVGEPGNADTFHIEVSGGPYDGYMNTGIIGGGNINLFPVK